MHHPVLNVNTIMNDTNIFLNNLNSVANIFECCCPVIRMSQTSTFSNSYKSFVMLIQKNKYIWYIFLVVNKLFFSATENGDYPSQPETNTQKASSRKLFRRRSSNSSWVSNRFSRARKAKDLSAAFNMLDYDAKVST